MAAKTALGMYGDVDWEIAQFDLSSHGTQRPLVGQQDRTVRPLTGQLDCNLSAADDRACDHEKVACDLRHARIDSLVYATKSCASKDSRCLLTDPRGVVTCNLSPICHELGLRRGS